MSLLALLLANQLLQVKFVPVMTNYGLTTKEIIIFISMVHKKNPVLSLSLTEIHHMTNCNPVQHLRDR